MSADGTRVAQAGELTREILSRLLEQLFERGVTLVTTSNIAPSGLYANGLQRSRFLPAIALLERDCVVHRLASDTDFRLRELTAAATWHVPIDAAGEAAMAEPLAGIKVKGEA